MSTGLVWQDEPLLASGQAAAHAIVIGVGEYPHLVGGTGPLTAKHGDLLQLSSPPASAFEFAQWLLEEFNNPDAPLASLSLLVSDSERRQFAHPRLATPVTPVVADSANVVRALKEWKKRGDANEKNLMLFFFCGHGVARGLDGLTLLLRDYGADDEMPMDGAIDFAAFQRGMAQCAASFQCFFVDACRQVSDTARNTTSTGQMVIQDDINRPFGSDWNYAVLFSTVEGTKAYGRKNKASFYTEELIKGLNGLAANNRNARGQWRVGTSDLNQAVHWGLSQRGKKIRNPAVRLVEFEFHMPKKPPNVPVTVSWCPREEGEMVKISCKRRGVVVRRFGPAAEKWVTELPFGSYDFKAVIGARTGLRSDEFVLPPYRDIEIEVAR
jgi:hypothetical protein